MRAEHRKRETFPRIIHHPAAVIMVPLSLALAMVAGAALAQAPELHRPTARVTWKAPWHNESASPAVIAKGKQGGPWSADFRRQKLPPAERERGK